MSKKGAGFHYAEGSRAEKNELIELYGASVLETKTHTRQRELHKRVFINKRCLDSSFFVAHIFS